MKLSPSATIAIALVLFVSGCGGSGSSPQRSASGGGERENSGGTSSGNPGGGGSVAASSDPGSTPLRVTPSSISFTATYGAASPPSQTVTATFGGDGVVVGTPPNVDMPQWLAVDHGNVSGASATFTLEVNTKGLMPGSHTTTLRFVTGKAHGTDLSKATNLNWVDLPVTYTITDDLAVSPTQLSLTPNNGTLVTQELQASFLSGAGPVAWTAKADAGLVLAKRSGDAGVPVEISYDTLAQPLAAGATTLNVQISAVISGSTITKSVPVNLDVGPHRIYALRNGVAFTSAPGVSKLDAMIPLVDNAGITTGTWSASADQPWLHVDGIQGDAVKFHADPSGLAEGLHFATVKISSNGPRVEGPESVRVGLFVSSATPVQGLLATGTSLYPLPDPVRPWIWLLAPKDGTKVNAYSVYSGAVEKQLTIPAAVSGLAISGDGTILYAGGMAVAGGYTGIARTDIETGEALAALPSHGNKVVTMIRPGGKEFVVTSAAECYDALTAAFSSNQSIFWDSFGWTFTSSADQRHLYGISNSVSPTQLALAHLELSGAASRLSLTAGGSTSLLNELAVEHLAVKPDGSTVTFPDGRAGIESKPFSVFGPDDSGKLVSLATFFGTAANDVSRGIDLAPDGRVITVAGTTIANYDALLGTRGPNSYTLPSTKDQAWSIRFSGDGERAILSGVTDGGATVALWSYPSR